MKTLFRLVGNTAQAEELAADAFYKFHQHLARDRSDENPARWLYRTALNLGLDALRANSRRLQREDRAGRENLMNETRLNPLNDLLAEERRDRVRSVISQLKPP